jgi:hypothetical protein
MTTRDNNNPATQVATDIATDVAIDKAEDKIAGRAAKDVTPVAKESAEDIARRTTVEATETATGKASKKIGVEATEVVTKKAGKEAAGVAVKEGGEAVVKKGVAKTAARALGPIVGAAFAGYDAYQGWNDKDMQREAFNLKEGQEADLSQKTSSAVANVIDMGGLGTSLAQMAGVDVNTGDVAREIDEGAGRAGSYWGNTIYDWMHGDENADWDPAAIRAKARAKGTKSAQVVDEKREQQETGEVMGETAGQIVAEAIKGELQKDEKENKIEDEEEKGFWGKVKGFFGMDEKKDKDGKEEKGFLSRMYDKITGRDSKKTVDATDGTPVEGIGAIAEKYESSGRGAGTISSGHGDYGGQSYGTYQLASRGGQSSTAAKYARQSKYSDEFEGLTPGTPAFNRKWREISERDPEGFAADQEQYIKRTHYDPVMAETQKRTGHDLSKRGKAVQQMMFSLSVQHGKYGPGIVQRALKGKDAADMTDEELINAVYDERGKRTASGELNYFQSSSRDVQESVANRFRNERADVLASLEAEKTIKPETVEPEAIAKTAPKPASKPARIVEAKEVSEPKSAAMKRTTPKIATLHPMEAKVERITTTEPKAGKGGVVSSDATDMKEIKNHLAKMSQSMERQEKTGQKRGVDPSKAPKSEIPINFDDTYLYHKSLDLV